jgi:Dullard-like phosphatase family protein
MSDDSRLGLVLDLDETLIFSSPIHSDSASIQVRVHRRRFFVRMRPGLADFIKSVSPHFDLYFFTSSSPEYANPIIDAIAPATVPDHRFTREHCVMQSGYAIKDLRLLGLPLKHVILVDDIDGSALFQPRNLIRVAPWYGIDERDNLLMGQLLPLLEAIARGSDVRIGIRNSLRTNRFSDVYPSQISDSSHTRTDL